MQEHSSMHAYLNWTKQRIDEMDATLASLEAKVSQLKADSKAKADHLLADLKERRHEFQAKAKAQAQAGEATLQASKAQSMRSLSRCCSREFRSVRGHRKPQSHEGRMEPTCPHSTAFRPFARDACRSFAGA